MNAIGAIQTSLANSKTLVHMLLADLSDADLLVRPVPGANHIAWQLGHVTVGEIEMLKKHIPDIGMPAVPEGFAEQHDVKKASADGGFLKKKDYLDLFDKVRAATVAAAAKLSEADLEKKTGWDFAPTLGALLLLCGDHTVMHAGQFSVVRRKLGKPVVM